jgi:hypothetical protein
VDFYKSGFPARYGGRLSSVVDVRTDDGDWNHIHGSYSIGLLDGRLHIEGPITPGKTSFNFGLRRSWIDILTRPAFAISNKKDKDEKLKLNYVFWDMNGKVSHRFSERSVLSLSLYSGIDGFKTFDKLLRIGTTAIQVTLTLLKTTSSGAISTQQLTGTTYSHINYSPTSPPSTRTTGRH